VMTPEERFLFDLQGYVVVEDALDDEGLARALAAHVELTGEAPEDTASVAMPIEHSDTLLSLADHEPVFARVRELVGGHPKLIDNDVVATPKTERTLGWHRGVEPWGYAFQQDRFACLMAKVIYYLTDVGPDDAPTRLVPGSHKQQVPFPLPEDPQAPLPGQLALEARAGSALLFSEALLHAGSPNRSGRIRRLAIYNYGPSFVEPWQGYRPSDALVERVDGTRRALLGGGVAYP
jgi:ectoine hydroxylase-related dioxygenase (phytanoyl-CoA dioxygenase family)